MLTSSRIWRCTVSSQSTDWKASFCHSATTISTSLQKRMSNTRSKCALYHSKIRLIIATVAVMQAVRSLLTSKWAHLRRSVAGSSEKRALVTTPRPSSSLTWALSSPWIRMRLFCRLSSAQIIQSSSRRRRSQATSMLNSLLSSLHLWHSVAKQAKRANQSSLKIVTGTRSTTD